MNHTVIETTKAYWELIVDNYNDEDEIFLPVIVGWSVMVVVYWALGLFLLFAETSDFNLFPIRKHQQDSPATFTKTSYAPGFKEMVQNVLFNHFFVVLPTLYLCQRFFRSLGLGVYVSRDLPTVFEVLWQVPLTFVLSDIFLFTSHFTLHQPWLYKNVHKLHHEFKAPYGLSALYVHWLEACVQNTLASMGVAFLLKAHVLVWWVGAVIGTSNTVLDHSGLDLPFQPSSKRKLKHLRNQHGLEGFVDFHDYHHQYFTGNYGINLFMDKLFGTDLGWIRKCEETSKLKIQ